MRSSNSNNFPRVSVRSLISSGAIANIIIRFSDKTTAFAEITKNNGLTVMIKVGRKTAELLFVNTTDADDHEKAYIYAYENDKGVHLRYGKSDYTDLHELFGIPSKPKQPIDTIRLHKLLNDEFSK
jgi:hypothetical protein